MPKKKKKIGIYQSKNEYPELHIMITDNPRYLELRKTMEKIEEAMKAIKQWLEKETSR